MGAKKRRRKGLISASRGGVGCYKQARLWHSNLCPARQDCGLARGLQSTKPKGDSPPEGLPLCFSNTRKNPCQSKKGDTQRQENRLITAFSPSSIGSSCVWRIATFRWHMFHPWASLRFGAFPGSRNVPPLALGNGTASKSGFFVDRASVQATSIFYHGTGLMHWIPLPPLAS